MQAFIEAVALLPLVLGAKANDGTENSVIVNVKTDWVGGDPNLGYDAETEATNKAIDALAAQHGLRFDNGDFDADGTECWYYRAKV